MQVKGILVRLDEPSTKAPNGSQGHKILLPTDVAKRRLGTLIGMGLNYAPSLETHAQRRKVGVIQKAYIQGKDLWVEGVVWKHDFPEAKRDLKQPNLGMSMELGDVSVKDEKADIWTLADLCFMGGTILYRDAAAYSKTRAIAAAAKAAQKGAVMAQRKQTQVTNATAKVVEMAAKAAVDAVGKQITPVLSQISTRLDALEAAGGDHKEPDEEEMCGSCGKMHAANACSMKAKADDEEEEDKDGDEEDDEMESAIDTGDLEELGPETGEDAESDDDPGQLNKGAKNKGAKTTSEDKVGKTVASSRLQASLERERTLRAQMQKQQRQIDQLSKDIKASKKQMAAASSRTERRSVPVPLDYMTKGLLSKSGLDAKEIQASGQKLTVEEVDRVFTASGSRMSPLERMHAKNRLLEAGMMEQGAVSRD